MEEVDPCANLEPTDKLLEWWKANRSNICRGNQRMAKKYDDLAEQIVDYRGQLCRILTLRHILRRHDAPDIDELRRLHPDLMRQFEKALDLYELRGDAERELQRLLMGGGGGGLAVQALVTKWLYEAGFRIADIEVEHEDGGDKHTFDIDIEDPNGNRWDVEVWHGTGQLAYEEMCTMTRGMYVQGEFYIDHGKRHPGMTYITEHGGKGDDADNNFRILTGKMGQMRRDRTGVVIAYTEHMQQPWRILILEEWGERLPENRCVIALRGGQGGFTKERRGTGYLVRSDKFGRVGEAKAMIESMKFEYVDHPIVEM